ncbi:MAG: nuclear transport factor 2 family protein [Bdellovibrionales bacterium]|nr:nuclear transport factor 2 family protein [Bdellovibrionales bacterium]
MNAEVEREQLRGLQQKFEQAVLNNEMDPLKEITHDDFSYVSFMDRSFMSFDSFATRWKQTHKEMIDTGKFEVHLNPEPTFFYDDIAVAHGNSSNKLVDKKGRSFDFTSHWTVIFKKVDDSWKVIRAHNSTNPFANPMLQYVVKMKLIITGIVCLGVGLGIGLLL